MYSAAGVAVPIDDALRCLWPPPAATRRRGRLFPGTLLVALSEWPRRCHSPPRTVGSPDGTYGGGARLRFAGMRAAASWQT